MIAVRIANMGHGRPKKGANLHLKNEDMATQVNVSKRSVLTARKVQKNCDPELCDAVSSGEIKVSDAVKAADLPEEEQKRITQEANLPFEGMMRSQPKMRPPR